MFFRPLNTLLILALPTVGLAAFDPPKNNVETQQIAMSEDLTSQVVLVLQNGSNECRAVPAVYQIDCYRQTFRRAGSTVSRYPDYNDAGKALRNVEKTLKAVLKQYPDKATPPLRNNGRTYKPIQPDAVKPAAAAFERARTEATTILLRARGPLKIHYERIAAVVGSKKLIIRSQLLKQMLLKRLT
jgi:hypothetical protein